MLRTLTLILDTSLNLLKTYFSTIQYTDNVNTEGHYQQMLYVMFHFMGGFPDVEEHTFGARIDIMLSSKTTIYVIELKINSTAQVALDQINKKAYTARYALENLPIAKIGINFDTATRTKSEWKVER